MLENYPSDQLEHLLILNEAGINNLFQTYPVLTEISTEHF